MVNLADIWLADKTLMIAGSGTIDPGEIAETVFGETLKSSHLFLYLYRRFGPPVDPVDNYKQTAAYTFTTPMAGVWLRVSIGASAHTALHFGYAVTREIHKAVERERSEQTDSWHRGKEQWCRENGVEVPDLPPYPKDEMPEEDFWIAFNAAMDARKKNEAALDRMLKEYLTANPEKKAELHHSRGPMLDRVNEALLAAIHDLERPTYIRDMYFNPVGRILDSDLEYNEETEESFYKNLPTAEYFGRDE